MGEFDYQVHKLLHKERSFLSLKEVKAVGESARSLFILLSIAAVAALIYIYHDALEADYIINQPISRISFSNYIGLRMFFAALLSVLYVFSYLKNYYFKLITFAVFAVALSAFMSDMSSIYA